MGAYSLPIPKPQCRCGKKATEKVYNTFNAFVGNYCTKHAAQRVKELDAAWVPNDGRVYGLEGPR